MRLIWLLFTFEEKRINKEIMIIIISENSAVLSWEAKTVGENPAKNFITKDRSIKKEIPIFCFKSISKIKVNTNKIRAKNTKIQKTETGNIEINDPSNFKKLDFMVVFTTNFKTIYSAISVNKIYLYFLNLAKTRLIRHNVKGIQSVNVRVYKPEDKPKYIFWNIE